MGQVACRYCSGRVARDDRFCRHCGGSTDGGSATTADRAIAAAVGGAAASLDARYRHLFEHAAHGSHDFCAGRHGNEVARLLRDELGRATIVDD